MRSPINYQTIPDIILTHDLTLAALLLFQSFTQEPDRKTVSDLLEAELSKHIKLCEVTILYHASLDLYWAELPRHAVQDVNTRTANHFRELGFQVEYQRQAVDMSVPSAHEPGQLVNTVVVESKILVKWFATLPVDKEKFTTECRRRKQLEDDYLLAHPPERLSTGDGPSLVRNGAVWAASVSETYRAEIQRHFHRAFFCVFDSSGKLLFREETDVSFGATFGPDVGDTAYWEQRALEIISGFRPIG